MRIENIHKKYGKKEVLRGVSFDAEKGCCIGILGGNGSGKSTLLNILAGVNKCDKGSFSHDGKDLFSDSGLRSRLVGYVPQNTPLLEELSALDNLRLWYTADGIKKGLSGGVLEMLGIGDFLKTPVCRMSGGMKKRLAIGCAVSHDPEILLLDEPSAALDLVCKEQISEYLRGYKKRGGMIILATHDIQELPLCDSLYILRGGVLAPYVYDGDSGKLVSELKL